VVGPDRKFLRLFNPRIDTWSDHFKLDKAVIQPRTDIGEATATLLRFNAPERVLQRKVLQQIGAYLVS
jgi:hypothetical protein